MGSDNNTVANQRFAEYLKSDEPGLLKKAQEAVNDFTRVKMREAGFARRILPPISISNDELDRQVDTSKPVKVVDREPNSPGSLMVPFGTTPMGRYIRGSRYRVMFARIQTPKFNVDVDELLTYHMDIRQVLSDNAIKDMLAEEDGKFIAATNAALGGSAGVTVTDTGTVQWRQTSSEVTREALAESLKIMPSTPNRLESAVALINNITIKDIMKFHRDEIGGDLSQELFINGFSEQKIMGVTFMVTIKSDLVPTNTVFYYAEPKFLGKFYMLYDSTMFMDKRAYNIEFFCYETIGAAIGNTAGVARIDFNAASTTSL